MGICYGINNENYVDYLGKEERKKINKRGPNRQKKQRIFVTSLFIFSYPYSTLFR